jgi:hypothetical protein
LFALKETSNISDGERGEKFAMPRLNMQEDFDGYEMNKNGGSLMKYLIFFDYTWYRIYAYYRSRNDGVEVLTASLISSLAQASILMSIWFPLHYFYYPSMGINKILTLSITFAFVFFNIIRYNKSRISKLDDTWKNEAVARKRKKGYFVMLYLILSLALMVTTAAYIGHLRNK